MKRRLLVLGAGRAQLPVLHAARRLGLSVLVADPDPAAPGFALADARVCCDLGDADRLTAEARGWGAHGALTFAADYPMPALARLCDTLGLPGPGAAAVLRATHKAHMRRALVAAGVRCPDFEHVTDLRLVEDVQPVELQAHALGAAERELVRHEHVRLAHHRGSSE